VTASIRIRGVILPLLFGVQPVHASEYNAVTCQSGSGTLNINWQAVDGPFAPCTGIEFTNGTAAEAATGTIAKSGIGVSNPLCRHRRLHARFVEQHVEPRRLRYDQPCADDVDPRSGGALFRRSMGSGW
jgi:hypothetical protein